jgi:hypothetical protein
MPYSTPEKRRQAYLDKREHYLLLSKQRYINKKEELLEYQKEYRRKNRLLINKKVVLARQAKLTTLVHFLGDCCAMCKQQFPLIVYDFHHNNPKEKEFSIGENMHKSLDALKQEALKCTLLCANCHRITHDCRTL